MSDPGGPTVVRTVEHGEASELPELKWGWRRGFVFAVVGALCAHVAWMSRHLVDVLTLRMTIANDQGLILVFALLYLAGANASEITQLIAAMKTTRKETVAQAAPPAVVTTTDVKVETQTDAPDPAAAADVPDKPAWERGA